MLEYLVAIWWKFVWKGFGGVVFLECHWGWDLRFQKTHTMANMLLAAVSAACCFLPVLGHRGL